MPIHRWSSCFYLFAYRFAASAVWMPAAWAHSGSADREMPPAFSWNADPWIVAGLFAAASLYVAGIRRLWGASHRGAGVPIWRLASFLAGLTVLIVALLSPLDSLGEELFSMHMAQHELLMLAAAPMMVAGRPLAVFVWAFPVVVRKRIARLSRTRAIRRPWLALNRPLSAWSQHAVILWVWHFPGLFQASLASDTVHTIQHLSFLFSALLFWSALTAGHTRLRYGTAVLYILTTVIHTGILGALLTFSPRAWYPVYAGRTGAWGLTLLEDQQLGGLIMWVPAGFVFLIAGVVAAARAISPEWGGNRHAAPSSGSRP